jgi:hypothetical protein
MTKFVIDGKKRKKVNIELCTINVASCALNFKVLIDNVIRARIQFPILFPKNAFYMHISNLMEI